MENIQWKIKLNYSILLHSKLNSLSWNIEGGRNFQNTILFWNSDVALITEQMENENEKEK